MRVVIIGGGPGGLYTAILLRRRGLAEHVRVIERNRADDTFGFGVVFSDQTLGNLEAADPESLAAIRERFYHWDDIDVFIGDERHRSTGHGFAGMSRMTLLELLQARARELDVQIDFETEVERLEDFTAGADLVVLADGVNSRFRSERAEALGPQIDWRPNRFVWLGTTVPYEAFTFLFKANEHGLFRIHAYRYQPDMSTFIAECTEETWLAAGFDQASEDETVAYLSELFADELAGHPLIKNRSLWRQFPTINCQRWYDGNHVIIGDAAHTAHFSIGSGTKLAMEDAITLTDALAARGEGSVDEALVVYDAARRKEIASVQRAAQVSLEWFEDTERYMGLAPTQFCFSLLTRSLRISHSNLKLRDPDFVAGVDRWFAEAAERQSGASARPGAEGSPPPPMFTPFKLRDCLIPNRVVVGPMSMYVAKDGVIDDWHLVHLGSRIVGGAGMVMCEMTDVSPEARITPGCAGLWHDGQVAGWRRVVEFARAHGDCRLGIQLGHAGRKGATKLLWEGMDEPLPEDAAWPLVSASPIPYFADRSQVPAELDEAGMQKVIADHVAAARRAAEAGFDLLELHMAHGYLLSSFLSPLTNTRQDGYGGSLEARLRFPLELLRAVREAWPESQPLACRISAVDWVEGGQTAADAVEVGKALAAAGCDLVDVSAGQVVPQQRPRYGRLFQTPFAERVRLEAGISTIVVGAISTYEDVNSILAAGRADLCALARVHLWDPYWTRHAAYSQGYPLPWPKPYSSLDGYVPRDWPREG